MRPAPLTLLFFAAAGLFSASVATAVPAALWTVGDGQSRLDAPEGHAWLKWTPAEGTAADGEGAEQEDIEGYDLEMRGPDGLLTTLDMVEPATFLSGLPEGETQMRVRARTQEKDGPWSEPLYVEVSYPSLAKVKVLGGIGLVLLAATVGLILAGHFRYRANEAPVDGAA